TPPRSTLFPYTTLFRSVWECSKQSGPALKPGLVKLRDLRNGVAKELGFADYFALQVAGYGMKTDEMVKLQDDFMRELRTLYLQRSEEHTSELQSLRHLV